MTKKVKSSEFIYVLENTVGTLGGYKIGRTNNPDARFKQLKVGTKAKVRMLVKVGDSRLVEKQLHRRFDAVRAPQSEWFDLSPSDLSEIKSKLDLVNTPAPVAVSQLLTAQALPQHTYFDRICFNFTSMFTEEPVLGIALILLMFASLIWQPFILLTLGLVFNLGVRILVN